jgi:2-polyprenyl-3-methyl-5-hydroxy-6-metoxy-1,4-benzoquinol methylase
MSLDKDDNYYFQARQEVLEHVPLSIKNLLDVGCGGGSFAGELKKRQQIEIWGVEINKNIAQQAEQKVDRLLVGDITKLVDDLPNDYFDCIVCNDVLEHIYDPDTLLKSFKLKLRKSGLLICSIPNVRFIRVLKDLMFKREWEYKESGIMDFTHIRFFTKTSMINMFHRLDYQILDIVGLNPKKVSVGFRILDFLLNGLLEDTRYPQFLCKATPKNIQITAS